MHAYKVLQGLLCLYLFMVVFDFDLMICLPIAFVFMFIPKTRSYAALRAADLDWIVGLGYSWGGYILGCSQRLASCLRHSARIGAGSQLTSGQE